MHGCFVSTEESAVFNETGSLENAQFKWKKQRFVCGKCASIPNGRLRVHYQAESSFRPLCRLGLSCRPTHGHNAAQESWHQVQPGCPSWCFQTPSATLKIVFFSWRVGKLELFKWDSCESASWKGRKVHEQVLASLSCCRPQGVFIAPCMRSDIRTELECGKKKLPTSGVVSHHIRHTRQWSRCYCRKSAGGNEHDAEKTTVGIWPPASCHATTRTASWEKLRCADSEFTLSGFRSVRTTTCADCEKQSRICAQKGKTKKKHKCSGRTYEQANR